MSIRSMLLRANHRIEILRPIETRTQTGGKAAGKNFLPMGEFQPVWVQPATTAVVNQYAARNIQVSHRIFMDVPPPKGIESDWRVVFKGRDMDVKGVINEDEMDRLWYIDTLET